MDIPAAGLPSVWSGVAGVACPLGPQRPCAAGCLEEHHLPALVGDQEESQGEAWGERVGEGGRG